MSISLLVQRGVPRGSVLGPIIFLLYAANVLQLIQRHQLQPHAYADYSQICGFCRFLETVTVSLQDRISACIDNMSSWMWANRLQLNPSKMEVLWCSSQRCQHQIPTRHVCIGSIAIQLVSSVCGLGVHVDSDLTIIIIIINRFV